MVTNVGDTDRMFRILIGLLLIGLAFAFGGFAWLLGLLGVIPVFTGITGRCPGYLHFGITTCN